LSAAGPRALRTPSLMDLKHQVKEGEIVPVTLVVETAGKRELQSRRTDCSST
jgi:hypothetical protein